MGLEAENTHICEPKKGVGDQLTNARWLRAGCKVVASSELGSLWAPRGHYIIKKEEIKTPLTT